MPTDFEGLTLALALTAGGAAVFAALITGVIQLFKTLAHGIVSGREQLLAFILAGIVVTAAMLSANQAGALVISIESVFAGLLAWYGIARIAMGIHDDVSRSAGGVGVA